ncbi:peptidyl-prolyl cis-trans isomerase, partial [Escherichia coli]|nr:peptidyl-prolyl cis-trans isomerase [Escherichia coli]
DWSSDVCSSDSAKRAKAQEILERAKKGEDFAELANEFTDDPGNDPTPGGKKRGGLYENVRTGQMIKSFEDAALARFGR